MDNGVAARVEEMYTAHVRLVRSVCRSLLRDRNEAEDAVQQTFLSAQRALANGSSPREPAAWLATIARNECLARVRERMREPLPVDAEPAELGTDAYSAAVSRYEVATLREALADLPRAQREAILLRELRGLSYDEVARALSVTTGAVESLIFRARRTLQVRLGEALPTLSPVALFSRLFGGGDVTMPVVAKVAAIGVGAAMLAGGAAIGPRAFGIGHAAKKVQHSAPRVHIEAAPPVISTPPARIWSRPAAKPAVPHRAEHETRGVESASSTDIAETSSSDSSSSDSSSSDSSSSDTSSPERESGDGSGTASDGPSTPPVHSHESSGGSGGSDDSGSGDSGSDDSGSGDSGG